MNLRKEKKSCVVFGNKMKGAFKDFMQIREDFLSIKDDVDAFSNKEKCVRVAAKKECDFFISCKNGYLCIGRMVGNLPLNIFKFKILEEKSFKDFENVLPPELYTKFAVLTFGVEEPMANVFVQFLTQKVQKVDINSIEYAFIMSKEENDIYTLSYCRVKKSIYEEIGPKFTMELENEYFNEERADESKVKKKKAQKNVSKTITKDTVGRIYIEKQDLKDIKMRKSVLKEDK